MNIDDPEDVTQKAFFKLWKIVPTWIKDSAKVPYGFSKKELNISTKFID